MVFHLGIPSAAAAALGTPARTVSTTTSTCPLSRQLTTPCRLPVRDSLLCCCLCVTIDIAIVRLRSASVAIFIVDSRSGCSCYGYHNGWKENSIIIDNVNTSSINTITNITSAIKNIANAMSFLPSPSSARPPLSATLHTSPLFVRLHVHDDDEGVLLADPRSHFAIVIAGPRSAAVLLSTCHNCHSCHCRIAFRL